MPRSRRERVFCFRAIRGVRAYVHACAIDGSRFDKWLGLILMTSVYNTYIFLRFSMERCEFLQEIAIHFS